MEKYIREVIKKYSDAEVLKTKRIPKGFKNESYLVTLTTGERFVLKFYAQSFLSDDIIENYSIIIDRLRSEGLPVLEPIKSKQTTFLTHVSNGEGNKQVTISRYVESSDFTDLYLNRVTVENIADVLKNLHSKLTLFKANGNTRTLNPVRTLESMLTDGVLNEIQDYFKGNLYRPARLDKYLESYTTTGNELLKYFKKQSNAMASRTQIIHGDFNLSNLNIVNNRVETIFDFDEMTLAPQTFEIGCSIVHLDEGFMFTDELFEVFLKEYFGSKLDAELIEEVYMFMLYRCFYRVSRYFTYYRKSKNKVEHYTKYQEKINKYQRTRAELLELHS